MPSQADNCPKHGPRNPGLKAGHWLDFVAFNPFLHQEINLRTSKSYHP